MLKPLLLIVDDDKRILELLAKFLLEHKYRIQTAASAAQAKSAIAASSIDLIILDIMMPQENGLSLLKMLRGKDSIYKDTPVILLSAQASLDEKIHGLMSGADDYLTKPFEPKELVARIEVVLRRSKQQKPTFKNILKLGAFNFHVESGILVVKDKDEEIYLTSSELMLLRVLAQHPKQAFARADLSQRVGFTVSERSIDVQINRLRRKIKDAEGRYIRTVRHVGYSLCPLN